jgi:hypothetical protein
MSQIATLMSQEEFRCDFRAAKFSPQQVRAVATPDRGSGNSEASTRPDLVARLWHALREWLRRPWSGSAVLHDADRASWRPSAPGWRGRHDPPLLSFATGVHALLIQQRSLIDDRTGRVPEPEASESGPPRCDGAGTRAT